MGKRRVGRSRLYAVNKLGKAAATSPGAGAESGVVSSTVIRSGHEIITEIAVDLGSSAGAFTAKAVDGDVIAVSNSSGTHSPGFLAKLDPAENGHIIAVDMTCLEAPAGASADIMLVATASATAKYDDAVTTTGDPVTLIDSNGNWALGDFKSYSEGAAVAAGSLAVSGNVGGDADALHHLYLANGAGANAGTYTAGKYVIRLYLNTTYIKGRTKCQGNIQSKKIQPPKEKNQKRLVKKNSQKKL
jgi:hypothetical protein